MYQRKLHYIYLDAHCQAFLKAAIVNFLQIEAKAIGATTQRAFRRHIIRERARVYIRACAKFFQSTKTAFCRLFCKKNTLRVLLKNFLMKMQNSVDFRLTLTKRFGYNARIIKSKPNRNAQPAEYGFRKHH